MIYINGILVDIGHFPAGEQKIDFHVEPCKVYNFAWKYENEAELISLFYLVNHILKNNSAIGALYLPYIPNARMDRVHDESTEIFTLKYFADFINSMNFVSVLVDDPHSSKSLELIHNCRATPTPYSNVRRIISMLNFNADNSVVFYPDAGSQKRFDMEGLSFPYLYGEKKRDWDSGKIIGLDVCGDVPTNPFNVLIVDDICSYGGTFLRSAKALKELGADKIYLYVTHCENSVVNGDMISSGLIEHIYTTNSIYRLENEMITVL